MNLLPKTHISLNKSIKNKIDKVIIDLHILCGDTNIGNKVKNNILNSILLFK